MKKIKLFFKKNTNSQKHNLDIRAFSLVELVVVISIFSIMTAVSTVNYNEYRSAIERANLSQDIALSIRQAQVYGISASAKNIGDISFDAGTVADEFFDNLSGIADVTQDKSIRGVSFDLAGNTIILFEDYNKNKVYYDTGNIATTDRIIDQRSILSNSIAFEYFYLCDGATCVKKTTGFLDIAFERPYPNAMINYRATNSSTATLVPYTKAIIVISDGTTVGENEYIEIYSIGNITVKSDHAI